MVMSGRWSSVAGRCALLAGIAVVVAGAVIAAMRSGASGGSTSAARSVVRSALRSVPRTAVPHEIEATSPEGLDVVKVRCTASSPTALACSGRFRSAYGSGNAYYTAVRTVGFATYGISPTVRLVFDHKIKGNFSAGIHD
jgi:hypothetical protein